MKSSTLFSIIIASTLAAGSVAYAQGRASAPGAGRAQAPMAAQGAASTSGTQAKVHTPGTGLLPGATPLQTRIHTPGTGLGTATPGAGQAAGSNGGRGIHTPGTGLVTPAPVPVPAGN